MTGRARGARTAILLVLGMATATAIAGWALAAQPRLRYGVHTLPADQRTLALAAEAGFDTVVELFSWRQIEPTRDQWHWQRPDEVVAGAAYHGLDLVVRLDQHPAWASAEPLTLNAPPDKLDDYVRFVERVAERYRGRVLGYVIWNEPNLAADWGGRRPNPEAYTQMLCRAYQAVKRADRPHRLSAPGWRRRTRTTPRPWTTAVTWTPCSGLTRPDASTRWVLTPMALPTRQTTHAEPTTG